MTSKKAPRRMERIFAFKVLYGLNFQPTLNVEALQKAFMETPDKPESQNSPEGFAWELVLGVWSNQTELDVAITSFSQNWRTDRMGKVEITLLRLAMYELTRRNDIPAKVAINEAVDLSKLFGDEKSRGFINGILDAAAKSLEVKSENSAPSM